MDVGTARATFDVLYHGTSNDAGQAILRDGVRIDRCTRGYFGRGFYCALDEALAWSNYADMCGEDGRVLKLQIAPSARILDLRLEEDADYWIKSRHSDLLARDDFPFLMRRAGIDGLYDNSFEGVVLYRPTVITQVMLLPERARVLRS